MRNLKRALSLGLTATMISGLMVMGSSAASYADVTSEQNQEAIEVLKAVDIMVGDEKGNFNPEAKVTRNEMAVVMSNLMAYNVASYKNTSPFTDVPEWAEPYVAACYTNGITSGYDKVTYGGNDSVTTAQAALMVMKALGYFQYQSDFGADWQLSTVAQGNKIDLFDDVDSGVKEAMTRNDLAQLVLNALESGTVEADDDTIKVENGDTTVTAGKLTMSTNAAFPPYEMTTDSGDFEGIDVEVAGAIAEKLGLELQVDDMDFDAALLAAQNGKSDIVMAGVTVTDERQKVMDFSDTYAEGIQSIIVPEDSDIASADDLTGKAIGTQRGTTGYIYCTDDFGEDNVIAYDDGLTAVQALNNGQVDAVVIDNAPAKSFVEANPGLKILDTAYAQEDYAIGVAKGNTQLLDAINSALEELQADGTLQAIVDKYITAE